MTPLRRKTVRSFQRRSLIGPERRQCWRCQSVPTVEFKCGDCGAVLIRGEEGRIYPLVVLCSSWDSYNSTAA